MSERIQKIMAERGLCSRRKAEELILQGRVTCNGRVAALGDRADPETDDILVDGKSLPSPEKPVYIMLHKPRGYVTTLSDEKGRPNASQLIDCGCRVYPVGRLDMDSEGLLLFTNDGEFANRMMHPKHQVDKTYRVTVRRYSADGVKRLENQEELEGYRICRPKVQVVHVEDGTDRAVLHITIHEGRNRQVRKMCANAGMQVVRLLRISEGSLKLGNLPRGNWRYLTPEELSRLK